MAREGDNCVQKRRGTAGSGGEVGEHGTGCCANVGPVLGKLAARLQAGEGGNPPCTGGWRGAPTC